MTQQAFDAFREAHEPRIKTYLQRVRDYLHLSGYTTKRVTRRKGIDWAFHFTAFVGTKTPIRVLFGVLRSEDYGDRPSAGIAFELVVEEIGGRLVDGWDPFLEDRGAWHPLTKPQKVEREFERIETIDPQEVLNIIETYRQEQFHERDQESA